MTTAASLLARLRRLEAAAPRGDRPLRVFFMPRDTEKLEAHFQAYPGPAGEDEPRSIIFKQDGARGP